MSEHHPDCWLAQHGHMEKDDPMPPCEGRLIRAHVISQQELRKRGLEKYTGDPSTYVLACGGLTGLTGHHGMFDMSKKLRVRFGELPQATLDFALNHNLTRYLERNYQ